MKIFFLARHQGYFRNYESVIRALASRGHSLHLAVERVDPTGLPLVEAMAAEFPALTCGEVPARADDEWTWVAGRLRLGLDYLRYQHRAFDDAYKLRSRAEERTPGVFVALGRMVHMAGEWSRRAASSVLRRLERAVPADVGIQRFVESHRPDLMLITPLIDLGSAQIDYLRAARALRVPTALGVWSWDHLSSKALIREAPDRVFVWNETQKHEAVTLHGVDEARIVVTGAQCFDQWFGRQPSRTREAFCRERGLDPAIPIVLYVCSALFAGSPVEAQLVETWIRAIRSQTREPLRNANILVRPHPSRTAEWDAVDVRPFGAVVFGRSPIDAQAKADYFDSLYFADAVVGVNTSAFIEAGILGRPVLSLALPEFAQNQAGTVHFQYLTTVAGGLITTASEMREHLRQLEAALAQPQSGRSAFVEAFVRPRGLDVPATPLFVDQVEALASVAPQAPSPAPGAAWRWVVGRLARTRTTRRLESWTLSSRERESLEHSRDELQRKAFLRAEARAGSDATRLEAIRRRAEAFELSRRSPVVHREPHDERGAAGTGR